MSFSVVGSVNHLVGEYRRFLLSTYRLADPRLREQFEAHIQETDVLVKGPYVTLANDFAREHTLLQLHGLGVGHRDLQRLKWGFGQNALFLHQEQAFRAVEGEDRNVVVKTGTGSGKTEAFLLPVLSGVLTLREMGVKGTKAILLYPMNALANDQLIRLRNLIRDSGLGVTFAMYTGESETVAATLAAEAMELRREETVYPLTECGRICRPKSRFGPCAMLGIRRVERGCRLCERQIAQARLRRRARRFSSGKSPLASASFLAWDQPLS